MKHIIHYCLLLCTGMCVAQDITKDTLWLNATLRQATEKEPVVAFETRHVKHDSLISLQRMDYPSKQVRRKIEISYPEHQGKITTWHANGQLHCEASLSLIQGTNHPILQYKCCYDPSGKAVMQNGQGTYMEWYADGQPSVRLEVNSGKTTGVHTCWDAQGQEVPATPTFLQTIISQEFANDILNQRNAEPINLAEFKTTLTYPVIAREAGIKGEVILHVRVDEKGAFSKHKILKQAHPILAQACEAEINKLTFTPRIWSGIPVVGWAEVLFIFSLHNTPPKAFKKRGTQISRIE